MSQSIASCPNEDRQHGIRSAVQGMRLLPCLTVHIDSKHSCSHTNLSTSPP